MCWEPIYNFKFKWFISIKINIIPIYRILLQRHLALDVILSVEISAALLIQDLLNCDNKTHYIHIIPTLKQATSLTLIRLRWTLCSNTAMKANYESLCC